MILAVITGRRVIMTLPIIVVMQVLTECSGCNYVGDEDRLYMEAVLRRSGDVGDGYSGDVGMVTVVMLGMVTVVMLGMVTAVMLEMVTAVMLGMFTLVILGMVTVVMLGMVTAVMLGMVTAVMLGMVTVVMKMPTIKTVMAVMILISIPLLNKKA